MSRRSPDAEVLRDVVHDEDENEEIESIERPAEIARQDRAALAWRERAQQVKHVIVPPSRGCSRWPRTIRIRQDARVTTAEPAIAVARDQVIDRVADHPWDELEDPCPVPARKRAQRAARLRILHSPGRSPRRQRNPGVTAMMQVVTRRRTPAA